ncbi:MAG: glucan biosynthesis protein G [Pseudomonadota bacterium]
MNRRTVLNGLMASAALGWAGTGALANGDAAVRLGEAQPFEPAMVIDRAKAMALKPFKARPEVPKAWKDLTYVQYRDIRFDRGHAVWEGSDAAARMDLFAPGLYFPRAVTVHVIEGPNARPIAFDKSLFTFGTEVPPLPMSDDLGFSGLRLRGSLSMPGFGEEFFVLQGASYFRAIGIGQAYGLSARGLALDTGEPTGEEFPEFIEFWVERPGSESPTTVIHALMDSPSVTGAYRFTVTPGDTTITEVSAHLFPRKALTHAGLAPLTSMFLFDGTSRDRFSDFRPAVHDSEGLAMVNGGGEQIWRPLANPRNLQISAFHDTGPKGFGLMQRHRAFSDFADLEANYHRRPSLWVEPMGDWGEGHVILVEIPADKEIYDNIVAFWRPKEPMPAEQDFALDYRLHWTTNPIGPAGNAALAKVTDSKIGKAPFGPGHTVVVDFAPTGLVPDDLGTLKPLVRSSVGDIRGVVVQRNPDTGGPRLAFHMDPGEAGLAELRAQLRGPDGPVSEVWLYRWTA